MNNFQNCLDYFHLQDLQHLITNILPKNKIAKRRNIDHDRAAYSMLLNHTVSQLQRYKIQAQKDKTIKSPSLIDRQLISPVLKQMTQLMERECNQKSLLIQIIFSFYKQSLIIMDLSSQENIKKTFLQYSRNLEFQRKQFEGQIDLLKSQLCQLKQENEKKWKTFYMIVKDNRVLRRQKGKLMRELHQQKLKLCTIHEEMMEIAKENQKYKLLANYQQSPESIALFLKNNLAISKLEYFMKKYPKQSKKLLKSDLKKLEISEHFGLDEKIMYIIKTAKESEQILDQYQDLIDINDKPNKLIFNISTQTDLFDVGIDPPNQKNSQVRASKKLVRNFHSQTQQKHLHINSNLIQIAQVFKKVQSCIARRRIALKTNAVEDLKIIEAVRHFTQHGMSRKVYNIKIIGKKQKLKMQMVINSNIYFLTIINNQAQHYHEFPQLPTSSKLQFDIKRSKEIYKKELERRSSSNKNIIRSSLGCISVNLQEDQKATIEQLKNSSKKEKYQQKVNSQTKNLIQNNTFPQKKIQKYKINAPQSKQANKKIRKERITNKSKFTTSRQLSNNNNKNNQSINRSNQKQTGKQNNNLIRKSTRKDKSIQLKSSNINTSSRLGTQDRSYFQQYTNSYLRNSIQNNKQTFMYPNPQQNKKMIRKSAFAAYKQLNTLPNHPLIEEENEDVQRIYPIQKQSQKQNQNQQQKQVHLAHNSHIFNHFNSDLVLTKYVSSNYSKSKTSKNKIVNIFAPENCKLFQKITKNIYLRRKEISKTNFPFQGFLNSFLMAQYGAQKNIVISNSLKGNNAGIDSHLLAVFDTLLDHTLSAQYLSHLFKIFGKILLLNNSQELLVSSSKKMYIEKEILTLHFSQEKYKALSQKNKIDEREQINICQVFFDLDYKLRKQMSSSQIYKFLNKLLPNSQKCLSFEEVKQIFQLFLLQEKYYHHLLVLKKCCNPQISIQNLCFYAIREQWQPLLYIEDFIQQKYKMTIENNDESFIEISNQYEWTRQLIKQKQKNGNNQTLILQKYLNVLEINFLLNKHSTISPLLSIIQNSMISLLMKKDLHDNNIF